MRQLLNLSEHKKLNTNYFKILIVHFSTEEDLKKFSKMLNKKKVNKNIYIENRLNILNFYLKQINKNKIKKLILSNNIKIWKKYWKEMPSFNQKRKTPFKSILLYFKNKEAVIYFSNLTKNKITKKTKYVYFPKKEKEKEQSNRCISTTIKNPKYPIYIISKGRWESRLTSKTLEYMKVPYFIVIEPQEYKKYSSVINKDKILVLPFSNLNQGSIPARNWVWENSIKKGFKKHWILDDNIRWFYRLTNNKKYTVTNSNIFYAIENFVDRFTNIGLAGMHYRFFASANEELPPFYLNTRIYSCILIDNSLPFKWRGKYNEDTDLSLRVLKNNLCTVLFTTFLCGKIATMKMKGGNTQEVYGDTDNRMEFAQSLKKQHPDVVKIIKRFNRWHHYVDYSKFKNNELKYKKGIKLKNKNNEFGMKLITKNNKFKKVLYNVN